MPNTQSPASDPLRARPLEIGALLPLGIAGGAVTGALLDAINGWISPLYFAIVMGWDRSSNFQIWLRAIAQGTLEGSVLGAVMGLILMIFIGLTTRLRCPLSISTRTLLETMALTLGFCFVMGFNAVLIALIYPRFYDLFLGLPPSQGDAVRYAWVAGTVWGPGFCALLATAIACARFSARWKRTLKVSESEPP